jgi:hypothetical protein
LIHEREPLDADNVTERGCLLDVVAVTEAALALPGDVLAAAGQAAILGRVIVKLAEDHGTAAGPLVDAVEEMLIEISSTPTRDCPAVAGNYSLH